jgi:hypothetical protein
VVLPPQLSRANLPSLSPLCFNVVLEGPPRKPDRLEKVSLVGRNGLLRAPTDQSTDRRECARVWGAEPRSQDLFLTTVRGPPMSLYGILENKNLKTETSAHSRQVKRTRLLARKLCSSMWKRPNCIRDYAGPLFPLRRAFVPPYFRLDFGRCHEGKEFRYRHCGASGLDLRSGK